MTTVLSLGTFDHVHIGHVELFTACRRMAGPDGRVVVAVNADAFVERFKGHRPDQSQAYRMTMVRAMRDVDEVVRNTGDEYAGVVIGRYPGCILAVGDDWAPPKDYLAQLHVDRSFLDERGVRIEFVPRTTGESTTAIRARMAAVA